MARSYGSTTLAKDMSSVVDLSNSSVNTSIEQPSSRHAVREVTCLQGGDYELEENFPCCYKPLDFFVFDRLPFLKWARKYRPRTFVSDVIAGLTVGMMVVPQALAYASIAGLPLEVCEEGRKI